MQSLSGKAVLVVEDEPLIAYVLQVDLEDVGARVVTATTRAGALAILERRTFDVAILDLRLGDGDCGEVASSLRAQGIPYVVASGDPMAEDYGAHARLDKPYLSAEVIAVALKVMQGSVAAISGELFTLAQGSQHEVGLRDRSS
jgi:CheY-like chemotaxis protein